MKPGTRLGNYEIIGPLGAGGMGEVYRARDLTLDREVALKLLSAESVEDPEHRGRLRREARSLAALNHAHIATVHGFEEREGISFIVMELIPGETLAERLRRGPLSIREALEVAVQIGRALEAAHQAGIVHRDLKPANVKLTPSGEVKVLDFGLAKKPRVEPPGTAETALETATVQPTRTGTVMGTPPYMSPEQIRGGDVDARTDVWAFGCVVYEMLTGDRAFDRETPSDTLAAILTQEPDWEALPDATPGSIRPLLQRSLRKDPDRRLHHIADARIEMEETLEPLRRAEGSGPTSGPTPGSGEGEVEPAGAPAETSGDTRKLVAGILAVGLVAAAAGLAGWALMNGSGTSDDGDHSIAVLPFDSIGAAGERPGAFVEGIHDGVLTELSRVGQLTVISRTSVKQYADTVKEIPTIARELGVSSILEGTVQQAGDRVRVAVRLVDAERDARVWAEAYDRELTAENLFAIQGELAKEIANQLHVRLTPEEKRRVERTPTASLDAYRLYLRGRALLDQRTATEMRQSREYFEQAIAQDPDYALAWAGLADALTLLVSYGHAEPDSVMPRAREALDRALELGPDMGETHASAALVHYIDRVGPKAIEALETAVQLRPGYAEAHNWLGYVRALVGGPEAALASARRSVELDPLSPEARANVALAYLILGEHRAALEEARRARELQPRYGTAHLYEALALYELGRMQQAREVLEGLEVPWTGSGALATRALLHTASGDDAAARRILSRLESNAEPANAGIVQAALGDTEAALGSFESIEAWGDWPTLVVRHLFVDELAPLREHPRFESITSAMERSWSIRPR